MKISRENSRKEDSNCYYWTCPTVYVKIYFMDICLESLALTETPGTYGRGQNCLLSQVKDEKRNSFF